MPRAWYWGVLLLGLGAWGFPGAVELSYFKVAAEGNDLVISWEASREESVQRYELRRRTPFSKGQYVLVAQLQAQGAGRTYRYVDRQVYKQTADEVAYQLWVVYGDGTAQQLAEQAINYTPTAVRRTWGSIKAMFQR
uniref:Fibronectin type III domain-containing protein n=2 Tax=Rhodothermus TaxID=29548 RepID=A0A7V2B2E8_RHOMR